MGTNLDQKINQTAFVRRNASSKQRRGRLLARLLIITLILNSVFILYNIWAWISFGLSSDRFSFLIGLVGIPALIGIWLLNKHGRTYLAAGLTLVLYFIRISMISNPDRFVIAFWAFILPIMIGSFIIVPLISFPVAGISALIYISISNFIGVSEKIDIIVFKLVLLFIFALVSFLTASHLDWAIETIDRSEVKYRNLFNNLPIGLYRTSPGGKILDVNTAFLEMFGLDEQQSLQDISAESLYADPSSRNQYLSIVEKTHSAEMLMRRMDGTMIWVNDNVSPIYDDSGDLIYYEGSLIDITEQKRAEAELEHLAITDPLTGLSNRRHFFTQAENMLKRATKPRSELAVVIIDIDHFKNINDQYGHLVGDEILQEVAHRIQKNLRSNDILGRYGGEEFTILLSRVNQEKITQVADRLCSAIADPVFRIGNQDIPASISMGIARLETPSTTLTVLLQKADQALYAAKQAGRDRWVLWHPGIPAK
jgi:diguanylate cyclase (GGDEF)-like protein/PAS domain S-box-containing protein